MTDTIDQPWTKLYPSVVRDFAAPEHTTLVEMLTASRDRYGSRIALTFEGKVWSFEELHDRAHAFARLLVAQGFGRGDRLGIALPNGPEYVVALFGAMIAGGMAVQVNHRYPAEEIGRILDDSGTEIVVATDQTAARCSDPSGFLGRALIEVSTDDGGPGRVDSIPFERLEDFISPEPYVTSVDASDIAVLQYTGGTTGAAKGVMLTHRNLVLNVEQRRAVSYALSDVPADAKSVNVLPMCHSYGLTAVTLTAVRCGLNQLLIPAFDAESMLATIKAEQPYAFAGVPTMYLALNRSDNVGTSGLDKVGTFGSAGAGFPLEQLEQFERITGNRIIEGFGITEASPATHTNPLFANRKVGSIGIPLPLTDVRIVDKDGETTDPLPVGEVGEMIIRGPQVMKGYWNQPVLTADALRDGWLLTGDLAHMDEDGYFFIDGRKKDMVVSGGFNVYPAEVEQVLARYPGVLEVAVIGVPDTYRGEAVSAFLVHQRPHEVTEAQLDAFCREALAAYKVPRDYHFVDALPRTAVGKIAKNQLSG